MEMCLAGRLGVSDTLFEDIFGFFDELTMQINRITVDPSNRIVLSEDEI